MSRWPAAKTQRVLAALLRIGWLKVRNLHPPCPAFPQHEIAIAREPSQFNARRPRT